MDMWAQKRPRDLVSSSQRTWSKKIFNNSLVNDCSICLLSPPASAKTLENPGTREAMLNHSSHSFSPGKIPNSWVRFIENKEICFEVGMGMKMFIKIGMDQKNKKK